jgi:hypothetical protein
VHRDERTGPLFAEALAHHKQLHSAAAPMTRNPGTAPGLRAGPGLMTDRA